MYAKKSMIKHCVGITSATVLMTMALPINNAHAATKDLVRPTISQSQKQNNDIREITRTIKVEDPYQGTQTIKQSVTFKKTSDGWQAITPSFWPGFVPVNYDDFEPSMMQVKAQEVTADSKGENITVTYRKYKIPDHQRLLKYKLSFYGYDANLHFTGKTWRGDLVKVGSWFDVPELPKGYEYLCPDEQWPKKMKMYRTGITPLQVLIKPVSSLVKETVKDHAVLNTENNKQENHPDKKEDVDTDVKSTPAADDKPARKEEGSQTTHNYKDEGTQVDTPSTSSGTTQTDEVVMTDDGSQTTMTSEEKASQTEEGKRQEQETQTEKNQEEKGTQTEKAEQKSTASQTDSSTLQTRETQTEEDAKEESSQTDKSLTDKNDKDHHQKELDINSGDQEKSAKQKTRDQRKNTGRPSLKEKRLEEHTSKQIEINGDHKKDERITEKKVAQEGMSEESSTGETPWTKTSHPERATDDNKDSSSLDDARIQQILDEDSSQLKKLKSGDRTNNSYKNENKQLPQTGNETDNKTTLIGILITVFVTALTSLFWLRREKK